MDLYNALKQGLTTEDELVKNFQKELTEAKTKLTKEKQQDQALIAARKDLIEALVYYIEVLTNEYFESDERQEMEEELLKILKECEKDDLKNELSAAKNLFTIKYKFDDDDILKSFLKELK